MKHGCPLEYHDRMAALSIVTKLQHKELSQSNTLNG